MTLRRHAAISPLVRCEEAMKRVLVRIKKYSLPRWHGTAEMDAERSLYEQDLGPSLWAEHRADIELLETERVLKYPGEVPK